MRDRHTKRRAHNRINLTGKRFGKLLVIKDTGLRSNKRPLYECQCDCGNIKNINGKYLLSGDTKSCGCLVSSRPSHNNDSVGEITLSFWTPIIRQAERRNIPFEVTREYAWNLYLRQGKLCAMSGVPICFSSNIRDQRGKQTASLDRIDSSKPYTENNIQWTHKKVNIMKNIMSVEEFSGWCSLVQDWMNKHPEYAKKSCGRDLPKVHTPA